MKEQVHTTFSRIIKVGKIVGFLEKTLAGIKTFY